MDNGQLLFLAFAAVVVLYQMYRGWRLGVVRQIARVCAIVLAYMAAFWGGPLTLPLLRPLGYPDCLLVLAGGAGLAMLTYFFLWLLSGILFKRTAHQTATPVWFLYGSLGALLGVVFGLVLVMFAVIAIRLFGGEWKQTLESGTLGEVLTTIDPVPRSIYTIADKIRQTTSNPAALERFLAFSGSTLAAQPEIVALRDDPDILAAVQDHRYLSLLKNEKFVAAVNSPKINEMVRQFDLEKALDQALKEEHK